MLGRPASTVHRVLARRGFSRLRDADRVTAAPVRYVACHPGALVHQDHKKLGRIPDGGGHRALGRSDRTHSRGVGYEHLEVLVDDASRYAVVVAVPDETAASARSALELAAAEFARLGIRIERVLTDNGRAYVSHEYGAVVAAVGARHKRTRLYRPQTNGRPNGSSGRCSGSGPTAVHTAQMPSALRPSRDSSTSTIVADLIQRSAAAYSAPG
jgi:transposase InsO family protein